MNDYPKSELSESFRKTIRAARNPKRAQHSTLPCRKEVGHDGIDWNGRRTHRSSVG